jgi:hypothetical protein
MQLPTKAHSVGKEEALKTELIDFIAAILRVATSL